jgi:hypothetical protein
MRTAALVACVLFVAGSTARAAPEPSFALVYRPPAGVGCPTEEALRASVAGELGYDPWDPVDDGGSPRIVVVIRAVRDGVRGRVEMRAVDGRRLGARELDGASCSELLRALALAIAVAIDPLRAGAPSSSSSASSSSPAPSSASASSSSPAASSAPSASSASSSVSSASLPPVPSARAAAGAFDELRLRVAFGVQGTVDAAPGPTFGFMGRVGLAIHRWSVAVELRGDLPGSAEIDGGRVSASTMAAFLVPCVAHRIVAFCVVAGGGGQEVAGSDYLLARSSWVPYVAVGGRIELELPVSRAMAVLFRVDVMAAVTRADLYVGTERPQRIYRSPAISNSFGVALSTR